MSLEAKVSQSENELHTSANVKNRIFNILQKSLVLEFAS